MATATHNQRLSSMDANFLYIETSRAPMHYLLLAVLEGDLAFEELTERVRSSLPTLPRYRQKAVPSRFNLRHPAWEFDLQFSLERHLFELRLEVPGTDAQLREAASRVLVGLMDRGKPLWEMYLVRGLAGRCSALLVKMHHCMADGASALELLKALMSGPAAQGSNVADALPERPREAKPTAGPQPEIDAARGTDEGESIQGRPAGLGRVRAGLRNVRVVLRAMTARRRPLPFNGTPSGGRVLCWCELPSAEVEAIRAACGGTTEDLVLTVLAGAVRRYLEAHGGAGARQDLRVMVSMNLRRGSRHGTLANDAVAYPIDMPLSLQDPLARHRYVTEKKEELRRARVPERADAFLTLLGKSPVLVQFLTAVMARNRPVLPYNMILTNVSSLRLPPSVLGRRVLGVYPFVPVPYSVGISCALVEYDDRISLVLAADAQAMPDAERLPELLAESFASLREAAGVVEIRPFIEQLEEAEEAERHALLVEHVRRELAAVLGWRGAELPSARQGFFDLGLDSLTALELRNRLQRGLGRGVAATALFEAPTAEGLARYLGREVLGWGAGSGAGGGQEAEGEGGLLERIQELSDEEVDRLLTGRRMNQGVVSG